MVNIILTKRVNYFMAKVSKFYLPKGVKVEWLFQCVKLLVCGEEWLSWLLTLQKLPMVLHQVMFSLLTVGRPLTSISRTIVPVSSV